MSKEKLKTLKDLECNILVNKANLDSKKEIAICPKCKLQKSAYFVGKECFICSVRNNEGDPLSGWKKRINFISVEIPEEKLGFEKGYFKSDVKEAVEKLKDEISNHKEERIFYYEIEDIIDKIFGDFK